MTVASKRLGTQWPITRTSETTFGELVDACSIFRSPSALIGPSFFSALKNKCFSLFDRTPSTERPSRTVTPMTCKRQKLWVIEWPEMLQREVIRCQLPEAPEAFPPVALDNSQNIGRINAPLVVPIRRCYFL